MNADPKLQGQSPPAIICAWCKKRIREGDPDRPVSHGICVLCMAESGGFPVEDLSRADAKLLDRLPFGIIRTKGDGQILSYSKGESAYSRLPAEAVLGKNFFQDVAPCTRVQEFAGWLEAMRAAKKSGREELSFVFKFPHGAMLVKIAMLYDSQTDTCTLLVKPIAQN